MESIFYTSALSLIWVETELEWEGVAVICGQSVAGHSYLHCGNHCCLASELRLRWVEGVHLRSRCFYCYCNFAVLLCEALPGEIGNKLWKESHGESVRLGLGSKLPNLPRTWSCWREQLKLVLSGPPSKSEASSYLILTFTAQQLFLYSRRALFS